jgi:hypothetical protein
MEEALKKAFRAGFDASGEGYNGEYPFRDNGRSPETDKDWVAQRDKAVQEILAEQPVQQQEPFGYLYEGTAEHTRHKTVFEKTRAERFETRWWREIGPCYTSPPQRKPLTEPQKQALAKNWFAEDWAITKAIGMMIDHERLLGIKEQP